MNKYANGLGPTSWGAFCRMLPFRNLFQLPAEVHDLAYCLGGTQYNKDCADYAFYIDCLEASGFNPFAMFFSLLYYLLVSLFGGFFFNYDEHN